MKAKALVPALTLAAALLVPPLTDGAQRHRSDRGGGRPAHGDYSRQPGPRGHGYSGRGYGSYGRGYGSYGYRHARPYSGSRRYYAPPPPYYGYGYGGYGYGGYEGYGYGYYPPPPPPRYDRPRVGVGIWFGF
jgi:hypothetical protein